MQALILGTVFAIMLVVGTSMSVGGLRRIGGRPAPLLVASLAQWLMLPAIAWGVTTLLATDALVSLALMLIAISPGGALSNAYTYLAGADTECSVALTSVSTLLAAATMPLLAGFWLAGASGVDSGTLALQLVATALAPVLIGLLLVERFPDPVAAAAPWLKGVVLLGIAVILAAVYAQHGDAVFHDAGTVALATLLFSVVAGSAGLALAVVLGRPGPERWAFVFEMGTRNLAVAALAGTAAGTPAVIIVAGLFLLVQTPLMLGLARLASGTFQA